MAFDPTLTRLDEFSLHHQWKRQCFWLWQSLVSESSVPRSLNFAAVQVRSSQVRFGVNCAVSLFPPRFDREYEYLYLSVAVFIQPLLQTLSGLLDEVSLSEICQDSKLSFVLMVAFWEKLGIPHFGPPRRQLRIRPRWGFRNAVRGQEAWV